MKNQINILPATNWLQRNWKIIVLVLVLIIGAWFYFNRTSYLEARIEKANDKNIQIETKVNILDSVLKIQQEERKSIKEQFSKDSISLVSIKNQLQILKNQKNEKINSIDNYTFSELELFFAERYGQVK